MMNARGANLEMIVQVAQRLGHLRDQVVFLGGAATGLLLTDPAATAVRSTHGVNFIVEVLSRLQYDLFIKDLLKQGFPRL